MLKGIEIADIHMGISDSYRIYKEMDFFKEYLKNSDADILNINGDFFDRKLFLNEPASIYAIMLFDELVQICKTNNIKMRVLQGTASHDLNQLKAFAHYMSDPELDLKIISSVEEEDIDGIKFLYVPEEYPEDSAEYYKEFKNKKYSVIHGHGTWDFTAFNSQIEESKRTDINSAPVFIYKEWESALENGVAIFGHIHGRDTYKKKIFYPGSYSRWGYGEKSDKGFTEYVIDDEKNVSVKFINNELAPKYETYSLNEIVEDINSADIELIKSTIEEYIKPNEFLRLEYFSIDENRLKLIKEYFNDKNISFISRNKKTSVIQLNEQKNEAFYDKYDYILNRKLLIDETIKRFAKEEYGRDIEIDNIRRCIL